MGLDTPKKNEYHKQSTIGVSSVSSRGTHTPNRSFMNGFDQGEAVKVCLRIRPVMEHEKKANAQMVLNKMNHTSC